MKRNEVVRLLEKPTERKLDFNRKPSLDEHTHVPNDRTPASPTTTVGIKLPNEQSRKPNAAAYKENKPDDNSFVHQQKVKKVKVILK